MNIKMDGLYGKSATNLSKMIDDYLSKLKIRLHKFTIMKMLVNFDHMQFIETEEMFIQIKSIDHIAEESNIKWHTHMAHDEFIWDIFSNMMDPELHLRLAVTETSKRHTKITLDELANFIKLLNDDSIESAMNKGDMYDKLFQITKTLNIIQQCDLKTILNYYCLEIIATAKISALIDY